MKRIKGWESLQGRKRLFPLALDGKEGRKGGRGGGFAKIFPKNDEAEMRPPAIAELRPPDVRGLVVMWLWGKGPGQLNNDKKASKYE